ncbi:hypothetical protein [Stenotrophomonas sp. CFBP 13718]|uniref:glycosyltransferase family 2 protein n=1 Tax=Stenotrophomonas sp. CFBP 13718 TaxID=2775304 RepID=UPI001784AEB5|nr:hypothetical protein [Stenotrophomonas sp. CFBP 13718]MBD8695844.1 hypothetical protein [Stenotrophomonas sp. CFBP 13718]
MRRSRRDNGSRDDTLQQLRDHVPHARAFAAIGGFDPAFFLYYEDDDLCLRMQEAGWRCVLQPAARALHPGGASSAPSVRTTFIKQFHYARSRQIALQRYVSG